jgi:hypothetical protein
MYAAENLLVPAYAQRDYQSGLINAFIHSLKQNKTFNLLN